MNLKNLVDEYTFKARLIPALMVLFPYIYVIHSAEMSTPALVNSLIINVIILLIMINVVRELGSAKQKKLFAAWGGKPTTIILRHRDNTLSPALKKHYHNLLGNIFGQKLPSEGFETSNPDAADEIYSACVKWLIDNTRDSSKYQALWQETVSYGFWRNMLALKSTGIAVAILAILIIAGAFALAQMGLYRLDVRMLLTPVISAIALFGWLRFVNANSVRNAAYAYARTLLAQCENVPESGRA